MRDSEKQELTSIVKQIPISDIKTQTISYLHKKYAFHYLYGTFKKYLRAFRTKDL